MTGRTILDPVAEPISDPLMASPLPAEYPRTATHLLLARGGDPFRQATSVLHAAHRTVTELIHFLPTGQQDLRGRFAALQAMLSAGAQSCQHWTISAERLARVHRNPPPPWGDTQVVDGAPAGASPPPVDHQDEPVYGFRTALHAAEEYLGSITRTVAAYRGPTHDNLYTLFLAGTLTHAASVVDHLAAAFTAAVWDFERPAMPPLPSSNGRIELRAGPRTIPQSRWARYARVLFLADRVEVTTASGHEVFAGDRAVAFLMHVIPPTTAVLRADPAERYTPVPLYDELGVIHFCDAGGRSLGAIAVADWLLQPEITAEQGATTGVAPPNLHQHGRLIWALQASGITAGAAVLGVPIRRGTAHPPATTPPATTSPGPDTDPRAAARVLRPGPHLQPHRGLGGRRRSASRRRVKKRIVVGPASVLQPALQYAAPPAIVSAGLGLAVVNRPGWLIQGAVLVALLAVLEPWLVFGWEWLRDRDWRRMVAVYRPGGSPGVPRRFAQRAALLFDGANIGVRGPAGHEAWVAASSDPDLGVNQVQRLIAHGQTWGFALADRLGHWRLVLRAEIWAPGGNLNGLAGFAQTAGLGVANIAASPIQPSADPFDAGADRLRRSRGPHTRAMVTLAITAMVTLVVTLFSSREAVLFLLTIAGLSMGPVLVRWLTGRWLDGAVSLRRRDHHAPSGQQHTAPIGVVR